MGFSLYIIEMRLAVLLLLLILVSLAASSPIRRYSAAVVPSNNVVIHAQVGEYVNISCWFDPKIAAAASRAAAAAAYELDENASSEDEALVSPFGFHRRRRRDVVDAEKEDEDEPPRHHRHRRRHHRSQRRQKPASTGGEAFLASNRVAAGGQDGETALVAPSTTDEENPEVKSYHVESPGGGKYEVDWFFLDRHGRMNIISYGNKTRSNLKYRTFVNVGRGGGSESPLLQHSDGPPMAYSSSALYSQSASSFLPPSYSSSARSVPPASAGKTYTHYLNAFIESEDDEGVYQCINPDWPNFIIRNITVLIGRNRAARTTWSFAGLLPLLFTLLLVTSRH